MRLLLVTSEALLWFHDCASRRVLEMLLAADPAVTAFVERAAMEGPNYGGNWFRCKEFAEASAMEVLYRCVSMVAREVACEAEMYVDALRCCAEREKEKKKEKGRNTAFSGLQDRRRGGRGKRAQQKTPARQKGRIHRPEPDVP